MVSCKIVNALYDAVPSRPFRDFLIRAHLDKCEGCQARLVSRHEAEALFVKPEDVGAVSGLWRMIDRRASLETEAPQRRAAGLRWELAAGAATFLVLAAASLWLLRGVQTESVRAGYARPADRFEINYINVGGAPAQAFIYQPAGSDTIFVWAGKTP
ncbi:MAG: hypothetical protein ACXVI6_07765 [Candidatus Aminicenantales bacterium]